MIVCHNYVDWFSLFSTKIYVVNGLWYIVMCETSMISHVAYDINCSNYVLFTLIFMRPICMSFNVSFIQHIYFKNLYILSMMQSRYNLPFTLCDISLNRLIIFNFKIPGIFSIFYSCYMFHMSRIVVEWFPLCYYGVLIMTNISFYVTYWLVQ